MDGASRLGDRSMARKQSAWKQRVQALVIADKERDLPRRCPYPEGVLEPCAPVRRARAATWTGAAGVSQGM